MNNAAIAAAAPERDTQQLHPGACANTPLPTRPTTRPAGAAASPSSSSASCGPASAGVANTTGMRESVPFMIY